MYPEWKGIEERRRSFRRKKMIGLTNIALKTNVPIRPEFEKSNEKICEYFEKCSLGGDIQRTFQGKGILSLLGGNIY